MRRDPAADGQFVYAVKTTGVFCHPSCGSRRPRRENVSFFDTAEAALGAGYRPCRRCRPLEGKRDDAGEAVRRAVAYIEAHPGESVRLADLARTAGLSPAHFQRTFTRLVGVSPRVFSEALRRERVKTGLRAGKGVSRAAWDAGYGSSRQFYEQGAKALGMKPAHYQRGGAGLAIRYTVVDSPVGRLLLAATDLGLCAAFFGESDTEVRKALGTEYPAAILTRDDAALAAMAATLAKHFAEGATLVALPVDVAGSPFERRVWGVLRTIPAGQTRTYAEVARAAGSPGAARAVGQACAANRLAVVIPCHRVVRADRAAGGYRWGVDRKRALLAREARSAAS